MSNRFNFEVKLSHWLTFDYSSRLLTLYFNEDDVLTETVHFTKDENRIIKDVFEKNNIGAIKGEYSIGTPTMYPSDQIVMKIYQDSSIQAVFHCTPGYKGRGRMEKGVATLCNTFLNMLYNKKEYMKMSQESEDRQVKYGEYLY